MSANLRLAGDHVGRLAEASAWRVALAEADLYTSEAFEDWLAQAPANEAAWDEVQASWVLVDDQAHSPELLALRRAALARVERRSASRWSGGGWFFRIAASLLLIISVAAGWSLFITGHRPTIYATAFGERRVVTLDDGSKLSLDSATEVSVDYSGDARRLVLTSGQARFDVAHDVTRPFTVRARDRLVVATGTAFNVDLIGRAVKVTLIEGRVSILSAPASNDPAAVRARPKRDVELKAGEQFVEMPAALPKVEAVNLERATSWESGQLVFDDEPLGSIAERVSRYAPRAVRADSAVADMKISGVFNTGDTATFVDTVERYLPVNAVHKGDGSTLLVRSD